MDGEGQLLEDFASADTGSSSSLAIQGPHPPLPPYITPSDALHVHKYGFHATCSYYFCENSLESQPICPSADNLLHR